MARLVLVHWNPQEAKRRAAQLVKGGHTVRIEGGTDSGWLRRLREDPPQAVIVDLDRLPSQGREVGAALRRGRATRRVPLVFVGGKPDKVKGVRALLPDARYTGWDRMQSALREAIRRPPENPVVPGTMDAYAGRSLSSKLGIRGECRVLLIGAPSGFEKSLDPLPTGAAVSRRRRIGNRLVLLFARDARDLESRLGLVRDRLEAGGSLWIFWPKKTSGVPTDLTGNLVRRTGLDRGWVDYKICAVDEVWSGLCFSRRKKKGHG